MAEQELDCETREKVSDGSDGPAPRAGLGRRRLLASGAAFLAAPGAALAAPRLPPPGPRRLALYNAHTGERFEGPYRDQCGPFEAAIEDLSHFLRDHHSGAMVPIDLGVIDFLAEVLTAIGAAKATILSAYRTPETNAKLARTNFGVAENSQHVQARALDVHVDSRLAQAAAAARSMRRGGVGWYPSSGFFHIDTGPVRNWTLSDSGLGSLLDPRHWEQQELKNAGLKGGAARRPAGKPGLPDPGERPPQLVVSGGDRPPLVIEARQHLTVTGGNPRIVTFGRTRAAIVQGDWTTLPSGRGGLPGLGKSG